MGDVLEEALDLLTDGLVTIGSKFGTGIQGIASNLFITTDTQGVNHLSTFGGLTMVFGGVSLAIGACTLVFNWLRSLGN